MSKILQKVSSSLSKRYFTLALTDTLRFHSRHHIHSRIRPDGQLPSHWRQRWPCRPLRAKRDSMPPTLASTSNRPVLTTSRKKHASTNFTPSSSHTSPSSTTSNHSKLKRRSTRSSGAGDKTRHIICCQQTTRRLSCGRCLRSRSRWWPKIISHKT